MNKQSASGFTLVELMVALAVLMIIFAIGLPAYRGYIQTSQEGVVITNIHTIELFQEDFFLRNGVYSEPHANIAAITAAIGWDPRTDDGITYSIADSNGTFYQVTGVHPEGTTVCIRFPEKTRC